MTSKNFKSEMTQRFVEVVKYLTMSETVHSKTEIGLLMDQPLQVVSKLLTGQRIITLEQTQKLILNTNINAHWFITGEGLMLKDQNTSLKESRMAYYIGGNKSSRAIAAMLPLVSDLEERMEELNKENKEIKQQMAGLKNSIGQFKKDNTPSNPPSKKSP
ncbi:MAG: hypothetical protein VW127_08630 [Flavobacteriaceae bacterium]|jgi:hypothetical protein